LCSSIGLEQGGQSHAGVQVQVLPQLVKTLLPYGWRVFFYGREETYLFAERSASEGDAASALSSSGLGAAASDAIIGSLVWANFIR
jgi:hypothetical protein